MLTEAGGHLLLAIMPKIGATVSIPCSLFIISECISDHRRGRGTPIQRALLGMSFVDVLATTGWWLSNWAVPASTGNLGLGNVASCNFQGFLLQLAIGAPLYNCSLALYYLLVIRYNWTNAQLVKIEKFVHAAILTFAIGTSIAGLPLTMYNRVGTVCWVVGSPPDCGNSITTFNAEVPCDRGDHAWAFGVFLFYFPLWLCVFLTVIAMVMIYLHVRATFARLRQYGFEDDSSDRWAFFNRRRSSVFQRSQPMAAASTVMTTPPVSGSAPAGNEPTSPTRPSAAVGRQSTMGRPSRVPNSVVREARRASKLAVFATQASLYSFSFFITWAPSTCWSVSHWFDVASFWFDFSAALCEPFQGALNLMVFLRRREESREKIRSALGCFGGIFMILVQETATQIKSFSIRRPSSQQQNSVIEHLGNPSAPLEQSAKSPSGVMSSAVLSSEGEFADI
jgi:hypothetical protein